MLQNFSGSVPLVELPSELVKEVQQLLLDCGYNLGVSGVNRNGVDGVVGALTLNAFNKFKEAHYLGQPNIIGPTTIQKLLRYKSKHKQSDFLTKEGTIKAIIAECKKQGLILKTQIAYLLATTEWETNRTFKPVREAYWLSEEWRRKNLRYYPYYGRGFVQITWKRNYERYGKILGINLVLNPDLALEPNVALFILVHGSKNGVFTGRKIENYINTTKVDYINARRVINGTDKAQEIAHLASRWEKKID